MNAGFLARLPDRVRELRWARVFLVLAGLGLCGGATFPVLSGKTRPPDGLLARAERALDDARSAGASRWAPDALLEAEAAMRVGLREHRIQETRFFLFRDFGLAEAATDLAEEKSRVAAVEASRRQREAKLRALDEIELASRATHTGTTIASAMHLAGRDRTLLQRSKIAVKEARALYDAGEYLDAADRARTATEQAHRVTERAAGTATRYTDPAQLRKWRRMVDETVRRSRKTGGNAIVVVKDRHRLTLYRKGRAIRTYTAELGYGSINDKIRAGDAATPEGQYRITVKRPVGSSEYHMALHLDYPNAEDRARFEKARRSGRIPRASSIGGQIAIHGEGGRGKDWTRGCIALTNRDIEDLFRRVAVGTPVTIVGADGNAGAFTEVALGGARGTGGTR